MLRRLCLLAFCLVLLLPNIVLAENDINPPLLPVIITEIYANAPGSRESGNEYIELHNTSSEIIDLTNFKLSREGSDSILMLDNFQLVAGEYLAIITPFSLLNSGGTVYLHYPTTEFELVIDQTYVSLDETSSWSLVDEMWQVAIPTPSEANPLPVVEEQEDGEVIIDDQSTTDEDLTQACQTETIFINEIVANPAGSDSAGGEFIELYNAGKSSVSLLGCIITTDKLDSMVLPDVTVAPNDFYVVSLSNDLLNNGGRVRFIAAENEQEIIYPALADDESWSILNGGWEVTSFVTPAAENQPSPEEPEKVSELNSVTPCPEGKFRNPETNRCKSIVETASSLLPCDAGSTRNPETNRCRKLTSISSSLKACDPGQERNAETNRCRKIQETANELKECDEGEERNVETNRCRKSGEVLSGATIEPPAQEAGIHSSVFFVMTLLAVLYGIYEYRLDFANWYQRLREQKILPKQR